MKKIRWILFALITGLSLSGCTMLIGQEGDVYGAMSYNTTYSVAGLWEHTSLPFGFPDPFYWNNLYKVNPGTYGFYYQLRYSSYYSSTYEATYTVTAKKGSLFTDGDDKNFVIYLDWYGAYYYEQNKVGNTVPETEKVIYDDDNITVTAKFVPIKELPAGVKPIDIVK